MSTKAILKIDEKFYNLLDVTYGFRRFTDYSGYVSNLIRFEKINIVISYPADTFFLQWMFTAAMQKSGAISFYDDEDIAKKVKVIVFAGAFCIDYKEVFQSTSGEPFHTRITLSAGGIKIEESIFRFPWFKGPLVAPNHPSVETIITQYIQEEEFTNDDSIQGATNSKNIATQNSLETATEVPVPKNISKGLQDKIGELNPTSQKLLIKDLFENDDIIKIFEDNHELVDSWKMFEDTKITELPIILARQEFNALGDEWIKKNPFTNKNMFNNNSGGYVVTHTNHNNLYPHEFSMAEAYAKEGKKVKLLSEKAAPNISTPDAEIIGDGLWDFKNINSNALPKNISKNIHNYVLNAKRQADNIAFNLMDNPNVTIEMVNQGVLDAVQTAKNSNLSSIADKVSVVYNDSTTKTINISEFNKDNGTRF